MTRHRRQHGDSASRQIRQVDLLFQAGRADQASPVMRQLARSLVESMAEFPGAPEVDAASATAAFKRWGCLSIDPILRETAIISRQLALHDIPTAGALVNAAVELLTTELSPVVDDLPALLANRLVFDGAPNNVAATALSRLGDAAVSPLIAKVRRGGNEETLAVGITLASIGVSAVDPLLDLCEEGDISLTSRALQALSCFPQHARSLRLLSGSQGSYEAMKAKLMGARVGRVVNGALASGDEHLARVAEGFEKFVEGM